MRSTSHSTKFRSGLLLLLASALAFPLAARAQQATLEVLVRATPSGGRAEPVRRLPFYLLRASLEDIRQAAAAELAAPSLAEFVAGLDVSDELKSWISRTGMADFRGETFARALIPDDLMAVPEFQAAYIEINQSMVGLGFPRYKGKLSDREKKPKRWKRMTREYYARVRAYLELHPESRDGLEAELKDTNPGPAWRRRLQKHEASLRKSMLRLIYSDYLAVQTETDLEGEARFEVPPGRYYLTNLWSPARAGDVSLRWELLVELPEAGGYRLELNNANALDTP